MATSKPEQGIGITTCPICLEEFKTPKCLPCLHNFCETCLNSYIITAFKSESKSKVGKSQFNCPVCRRMVTPPNPAVKHQEWAKQFPLNHTVVSLMDQNKLKAKEKLCDPCKSIGNDVIAVSWCHDCNEALCEACVNVHQKLKISRDHDIKNVDELVTLPIVTSLKKLFTLSKSVGQIDVAKKPSSSGERYLKLRNIVGMNLRECLPEVVSSFFIRDKCGVHTLVFGGCFMPDNTLLLPLFDGRKLALFKSNGDLIKQSRNLSSYVYDVCMIDPTTAVVTRCGDHVIDYINVPTLTVNKTVSVGTCCYGITCSDNKLYVGCRNKLRILDKDGNKEKKINTNGNIYGVTIIHKREKKIVYTSYNNHSCHFVRSSDLQEVDRFTHPGLKCPRGVTSDREGNVYIAGESPGNVFQLSSEGDLIRVLLQGLERPCGIQFDGDTDRFFVSYSFSTRINIYNMIKP